MNTTKSTLYVALVLAGALVGSFATLLVADDDKLVQSDAGYVCERVTAGGPATLPRPVARPER